MVDKNNWNPSSRSGCGAVVLRVRSNGPRVRPPWCGPDSAEELGLLAHPLVQLRLLQAVVAQVALQARALRRGAVQAAALQGRNKRRRALLAEQLAHARCHLDAIQAVMARIHIHERR